MIFTLLVVFGSLENAEILEGFFEFFFIISYLIVVTHPATRKQLGDVG
jgi:succinate-acetate transporter protein